MEYDRLHLILPNEPRTWNVNDVGKWLQFIGLEKMFPLFRQASVDGSCLEILLESDLEEIGVDSNIKRKKLMQWITIGLKEYNRYLKAKPQPSFQQPVSHHWVNTQVHSRPPLEQSNANYDSKVLDEKAAQQNPIRKYEIFPGISNPRMNLHKHQPQPMGTLGSLSSGVGTITEQQLAAQLRPINPFVTLLDQSFCSPGAAEENYEYKNKRQKQSPKRRSPEKRIFDRPPKQQQNYTPTQTPSLQDIDDMVPRFGTPRFDQEIKPTFSQLDISLMQDPQGGGSTTFTLNQENGSFGRNPDCLIKIQSDQASRIHSWIIFRDQNFYIQDRGSLTGTFIFLQGRTLVKQNFIIQMGAYDYTIQEVKVTGKGTTQSQNVECSVTLVSEAGTFTFQLLCNDTMMVFGTQNVPSLQHDQTLNIMHSQWSYTNEGLVVEDLDSTYGTWLRLSKASLQSLLFPVTSQRIIKIANHVYQITPKQ